MRVIDALIKVGLARSQSEGRRIIIQGGAYVNNNRVESIERVLGPEDLIAGSSTIVLRTGKKNFAMLNFTDTNRDSEE